MMPTELDIIKQILKYSYILYDSTFLTAGYIVNYIMHHVFIHTF